MAAYLAERFPPGTYTFLVLAFTWAAWSVMGSLSGAVSPAWRGLAAGAVVLLVFFHVRVFDEHKDAAEDRVAYPERLLSRGVVSLGLLARLGLVAGLVEAGLSVALGPRALGACAVVLAFTLLMRVEFGLGAWLRPRLLLYALSHNPVVALLALFLWAASGTPWSWAYLWFVGFISLAMLGFELGRKLHLPAEETPGVPSYSSVYGRSRALALVAISILAAVACGAGTLAALAPDGPAQADSSSLFGQHWSLVAAGLLWALSGLSLFGLVRPELPGKGVELVCTGVLILGLASLGVAGC